MQRTDIYLQLVLDQPLILAPFVGFIFLFLLVPRHRWLFISLVILIPWLTVARSPGLGAISAAAKLSSGSVFLLVAIAAILHPFEKRKIPGILLVYPIMAFIWIFLVLGVDERNVAIVLRVQWLLVTIAAVLVLRTLVYYEDFMRIVNAFTIGCIIALMIPISSLVLNPAESFLRGIGRFQPYGTNSNQIGMLFALATPLIAYAMLTWKRPLLRPILIFLLTLTIGMALMTGSRMTVLAIALVMLPILFVLTKRPVITIVGVAFAIVSLGWMMSLGDNLPLGRLVSLETQRTELWSRYVSDVFSQRPLFGLLGTTGESFFRANEVGQHPHSAWFNLMYHGGLFLFIPMFLMVIYSTFAGYQVWRVRKLLGGDPLLYSMMFVLMIAMYVQGCFNQVVYWPTYSWSFLHVVLAVFFITIWQTIRDGNIDGALVEAYDPDYEWDDYEEFEELEQFEDYAATSH